MSSSPHPIESVAPAVLRVAVLLDLHRISAGDIQLLDGLKDARNIRLTAVLLPRAPAGWSGISRLANMLLRIHSFLDRRLSGEHSSARQLELLLAGLPPEVLLLTRPSQATDDLLNLNLDVIAALHPLADMLSYAHFARYGVWWLGATPVTAAAANYLSELRAAIDDSGPITEGLWMATAAAPEPRAVAFGSARLISNVSVVRNRRIMEPVRRALMLSWLQRLQQCGSKSVHPQNASDLADLRSSSCVSAASAAFPALAAGITRAGVRKLRNRLQPRRWEERYTVGLRARGPNPDSFSDLTGYQWLPMRTGHWVADPFLVTAHARDFLFMEEMDEAKGRARIVCGEVDSRGAVDALQPVLERPHHLSYPHVFTHGDEIFMIPESGSVGRVELYRATSFPSAWELVRVLFEGRAFDTSMHYDGDNFWFFTSLIEDDSAQASELRLYRSDRLDGDWIEHPCNPICCDVRYSRMAGRIIRFGSQLLRPAQDCGVSYGGSMSFRKIDVLTESHYQESNFVVLSLRQPFNMVGPHTYDQTACTEVIDGRRFVARE